MREFVEYIFKQITSHPDRIEIEETEDAGLTVYKVRVAPEDMGAVIGKEGKTINSVRSLVRAKAMKESARVRIELVEE